MTSDAGSLPPGGDVIQQRRLTGAERARDEQHGQRRAAHTLCERTSFVLGEERDRRLLRGLAGGVRVGSHAVVA